MYTFSENSIDFISTDWFFVFMKIKMESSSYLQVRIPITDFVMQIWSSILEKKRIICSERADQWLLGVRSNRGEKGRGWQGKVKAC